jgi:cytochrome c oxidase subunit 2
MSLRRLASGLTLPLALAVLFLPQRVAPGQGGEREVRILARQYSFEPAVVTVTKGDLVRIRLETADVVHGLYIEGYDLDVQAEASQPGALTLRADRAGTFRLRCSVVCGSQHPLMTGELRVQPAFGLWQLALAAGLAAMGGALNVGGKGSASKA